MNDILKKVDDFYKTEIKSVKNTLDNNLYRFKPKEVVNNAIQRCLGVAFFVQSLDVSYNEIDTVYEATRTQLYDLLKEKE
jgi:predicted ATP-dependent Lon-type protease